MGVNRINIDKSIVERRLIYKKGFPFYLIDSFITFTYILIFPFIGFVNVYKNGFSFYSSFFLIIALVFFFVLLYSEVSSFRLKKIIGIEKQKNKEILRKIVNKNPSWIIFHDNKDVIIVRKGYDWHSWDWGKEVVIIFSENQIFINCITFGRNNLRSPFHWFLNRKIENCILKEFDAVKKLIPKN